MEGMNEKSINYDVVGVFPIRIVETAPRDQFYAVVASLLRLIPYCTRMAFITPSIVIRRENQFSLRSTERKALHRFGPQSRARYHAVAARSQRTSRTVDKLYFATCARGLGEFLASELTSRHVRAQVVHVAASGVTFRGDTATAYRACLWLRTATRVLEHLSTVRTGDVYEAIRECDVRWDEVIGRHSTFEVQVRPQYEKLQVRAKDAVCDELRDAGRGKPPKPDGTADVTLFIAVHENTTKIYQSLVGGSLHKRGYRGEVMHRGSLNETVAAGMLYMAGYDPEGVRLEGDGDIVDPMCGSGSLVLEAALLRHQIAPGLLRRTKFAFENSPQFDRQLYEACRREAIAAEKHDIAPMLLGTDRHHGAVELAKEARHIAGLRDSIELYMRDITRVRLRNPPALVLCNPPWGRRLEAGEAWYQLGQWLREEAPESTAVVLSGDAQATRAMRMKAKRKFPLRIGNVDCRVLVYDVLKKKVVQVEEETDVHPALPIS